MQQNLTDPEQRFCYKCHHPAGAFDPKCPHCGGPLKTKKTIRILGGVLVFLGGFISAIMAVVMVLVLGILSQTRASAIRGEEGKMWLALGIIALTFGVGVSFAIAGLVQMITGRRNAVIVWIALGLVVVLLFIGRIFTAL